MGNFRGDKFWRLIAIRQIKTRHFIPLCACSMAHGHKFVKLKPANHSNSPKFLPSKITRYTVNELTFAYCVIENNELHVSCILAIVKLNSELIMVIELLYRSLEALYITEDNTSIKLLNVDLSLTR